MKSLTLAAVATVALLSSAALPAFAGDMKDQGPINTNPPAFGASAASAPSTAMPAPNWGTGAGPVSKSPAYSARNAAAPTNSQLADDLRGKVYVAPAQ